MSSEWNFLMLLNAFKITFYALSKVLFKKRRNSQRIRIF